MQERNKNHRKIHKKAHMKKDIETHNYMSNIDLEH